MTRKIIFFDIDGTIWDRNNDIPESTIRTIRELRKNGHLVFICSGRGRAYIRNRKLLDIGFDGIVSGCATMIEYHGQTLFYKELDKELVADTIDLVRSYRFRPILEGRNYLYFDLPDFQGDAYGQKLIRELEDRLKPISENWKQWECSKFSCAMEEEDHTECFEKLSGNFDIIVHSPVVAEMVPKGFHKGLGITKTCQLLGIDVKDSYAFGDSANDLEMIECRMALALRPACWRRQQFP